MTPAAPIAASLDTRRDPIAIGFVITALATLALPVPVAVLLALAELLAVVLALRHAKGIAAVQRSAIGPLGHITAVSAAVLICVLFMARYVHYIGFETQAKASVCLILALTFLLPLRRPIH